MFVKALMCMDKLLISFFKKRFYLFLFYGHECFVCRYVCAPSVYPVPAEAGRGPPQQPHLFILTEIWSLELGLLGEAVGWDGEVHCVPQCVGLFSVSAALLGEAWLL